jgi:hypothetical protein
LLALSSEHPRAVEPRLAILRKRLRQVFSQLLLTSSSHPRERHGERGIRWNRDGRRTQVPVGVACLRPFLIRMLEHPRPLSLAHERGRLLTTRRLVRRVEVGPVFAPHELLLIVVALLANAIKRQAKRVLDRVVADRAVPSTVMPRHTYRQMLHRPVDSS